MTVGNCRRQKKRAFFGFGKLSGPKREKSKMDRSADQIIYFWTKTARNGTNDGRFDQTEVLSNNQKVNGTFQMVRKSAMS